MLLNDGTTGPAYDGPEGKGAGLKIASFAKTPFNAEAYYPHRIWWVAREEFLAKNPKAVVALMVAVHRATQITNKMTPDQVIDLASQDWFSDRAAQRPYVENILYRRRGWSWITEGDARTLVGSSQVKSIYQSALTAAGVTKVLKLSAPLAREAWERVAKEPGVDAFTRTDAGDLHGKPHWESNSWSLS